MQKMVPSLGRRGTPKFSAHIWRPPEYNAKSSSFDWPRVSAITSTLCAPRMLKLRMCRNWAMHWLNVCSTLLAEPMYATKRCKSFSKLDLSQAFFPTCLTVRCQACKETSEAVAEANCLSDCVARGTSLRTRSALGPGPNQSLQRGVAIGREFGCR